MLPNRIVLFLWWILCSSFLFGQASLQVIVTGGSSNTSCTDIFSAPDPLWQVNVNNTGWNTYPFVNNCFNTLPHIAYSRDIDCPFDLPATINICLKAFENDGLFGCQISESCTEQICQDYPVPSSGQFDFRLDLPVGGSSEGFVTFSIVIAGNFLGQDNDLICDAVDLGLVANGSRAGNALFGGFDNFCGTPNMDPNPQSFNPGDWRNDAAVWFTFETDLNPAGMIAIVGLNDPTSLGDNIHLQMALFESSTGDCSGNLTMLESRNLTNDFNCFLNLRCPKPSTRYYVLVDGWDGNLADQKGYFGIEAIDIGLPEAGDLRCDFIDLGSVPAGSYTATLSPYTNYCATNIGDPPATGFVVQKSVYFAFNAPPSGHVNVEVISDKLIDSIGAQIVIYRSSNDECTGFFSQVVSAYDYRDLDESVELSCLVPGRRYFLMIDGDGNHSTGIFNIKITDLGDDTPLTFLTDTICFNGIYSVGNSNYSLTGMYTDTLILPGGCDSVVYLDLTVLAPMYISGNQSQRAIGLNHPSGEFQVGAVGGHGNYSFQWSNGQTGPRASGLDGGQIYCVTATDHFGCQTDTCFYVTYITPIIPEVNVNNVKCFGGSDGQIEFSVSNGEPPYNYSWYAENDPTMAGAGTLIADNEPLILTSLTSGIYHFLVRDAFTDTSFQVQVAEPPKIVIQKLTQTNASCFNECDGSIEVNANGGTGLLRYNWSNGTSGPVASQLCAGNHYLTVTDENQCRAIAFFEIDEPEPFEVELIVENEISCFGDSTGVISVRTNGNPVEWNWGQNVIGTDTIRNLGSGYYAVLVKNFDGCTSIGNIILTQPGAPLDAEIIVLDPIVCNGDKNAVISVNPIGPGTNFTYWWNSGNTTRQLDNAGSGTYIALVTNEKGCEAKDTFYLEEPDLLEINFDVNHLNCLNPVDGGSIGIQNTSGGIGPYVYSLDGISYNASPQIQNLSPGSYDLWIQDDLGCEKAFPFSVLPPPDIRVSIGDNVSIALGENVSITAQTNSLNPSFSWNGAGAFNCLNADCSQVSFQPIQNQTLLVEVMDSASFCTATDAIHINVINNLKVYVPNAFSPNGDGINDVFTAYADNSVGQIKFLRIFDRYGSLLFEAENFPPNDGTLGWDGYFNNRQLDPGVYVWMLEIEFLDGSTELFKGDITIVR